MNAADIVVLSTTSAREALTELVPMFQSITGHTVSVSYSPGSGMGDRIRSGAAGDLLIAPAEFSDPLIKEGRLIAGSRVDFARSGSAVAVRAGTPKPDIGSPESFKQALIAARTVSYSRGSSCLQFVEAIARLGIADVVKQKSVLPESGELVGAVVARGAAEIGIQQLSELLPVPGIDIVGPLPVRCRRRSSMGRRASKRQGAGGRQGLRDLSDIHDCRPCPQEARVGPDVATTFLRNPDCCAAVVRPRGMPQQR